MLRFPSTVLKAAGELLGLNHDQAEALAGVSRKTIQRAEAGDQVTTRPVARDVPQPF
ncbi:antitoxin Xre-like helix-turn-helix domain-containing protein [Rhizobium sp. RAF56]|uniref:antitoxin Xre-like helix-turn-helix domain-containing protein n=1 Tax=Rhizobium sp. RAF56 TaxID=3233062 RepID=UPI003F9B4238